MIGALDTDLEYYHSGSRLLVRANEWESRRRNASFTLRGSDLNEAERWLVQGTRQKQGPTALQMEYINASRRVANTRQRIALGAVSVGLVVTLLLSLVSFFQFQSAQTEAHIAQNNAATAIAERNVAQSHALVANANALRSQNQVDLALLLSQQALQTDNDYEARDSLLSALEYPQIDTVLRSSVANYQHVESLSFSPDGRTLASAYLNYGTSTVEDGFSNDSVTKDGKLVGSISPASDRPFSGISLWDITKRQPHDLLMPTILEQGEALAGLWSVAFNPNGKSFASAGFGGVWLWDAKTGAPLAQYPLGTVSPDWVSRLIFTKDGKHLVAEGCVASCTQQQLQILVWDVISRNLVSFTVPVTSDGVFVRFTDPIALSPDGKYLVMGGCDDPTCSKSRGPDYLLFWDIGAGKFSGLPLLESLSRSPFTDVQFSPDGTLLADANEDGTIKLWNMASRKLVATLIGQTGLVDSLAFNTNSSILASGGTDKSIRLWDVAKKSLIGNPLTGQQDEITSLAWSSKNQLASGGITGSIILWNTGNTVPVGQIVQDQILNTEAYSADGRFFASGGENGPIVLRDRTTLTILGTMSDPFSQSTVNALAFSPNGDILASGLRDGSIILWDVMSRKMISALPNSLSLPFWQVAFSPDGSIVAGSQVGSNSGSITLWNVANHTIMTQFTSYTDPSSRETYTPFASGGSWGFIQSGRTLVMLVSHEVDSNTQTFALLLWDTETRKAVGSLFANSSPNDPYEDMSVSPDGQKIAVISDKGIGTLWDSVTKQLIRQFAVNDGSDAHLQIAFNPNGKLLAITGVDTNSLQESISLWDTTTNSLVAHPFKYPELGLGGPIAFDPNGQALAAIAGYPPHIVFLDIGLARWEARACSIANRNFTLNEWQQFIGNQPYRRICPQLPEPDSVIEEMLEQAHTAAGRGDTNIAENDYKQAAQWAVETSNPIVNNYVCWYGSIDQFAKKVMQACEHAVALEPENGIYRDSRGIARALVGDTNGAIDDFKFFATWATVNNLYPDKPYVSERERWIINLQANVNPFDASTLTALQNE